MNYLSVYGKERCHTFKGLLNGKIYYTPEKRAQIDPDIVTERDFSLRLQGVLSCYTNEEVLLSNVLPLISSNIGSLYKISSHCSLWRPLNHLSVLGELLLSGFVENMVPEELQYPQYFVADFEDSGLSFAHAFSLEKKKIFISSDLIPKTVLPLSNENTKIYQFDPKDRLLVHKSVDKVQRICTDRSNFIRVIGHISTIIQALFETERRMLRFYQDPVSLVLPADNIEFILAAFYLVQVNFPIKSIYAVSSCHRMTHNFFQKGEFKISNLELFEHLEVSLDRLLFEAARGSIEKVHQWKHMLKKTGAFKVDSITLDILKSVISPIFYTPSKYEEIQQTFPDYPDLQSTYISHVVHHISQETSEHVLGFDLQDPSLKSSDQVIPFFSPESIN